MVFRTVRLIPKPKPEIPQSYFLTKAELYYDELTTGERWKQILENAKIEHSLPDDKAASLKAKLQMQKEKWPHDMKSIESLEPREKNANKITRSIHGSK